MKYLLLTLAVLASLALILTSMLGTYLIASAFLSPTMALGTTMVFVVAGTMSLSALS